MTLFIEDSSFTAVFQISTSCMEFLGLKMDNLASLELMCVHSKNTFYEPYDYSLFGLPHQDEETSPIFHFVWLLNEWVCLLSRIATQGMKLQ